MPHFGLQITSFTYPGVADRELFNTVAHIASTAETAGFDSVWVMDHFFQIPGVGHRSEPMLEGYTLLGALAAVTSRVELGTLVTGVTHRNPALVAKMVTTLDVISAGRALCGLGAAWFEDEHRALGFAFPSAGDRLDRLEEATQVCRTMFTSEGRPVSFDGTHYRLADALNRPPPVRPGGPPILVGGSGERRTLRIVARHADMSNLFGDVDTIRRRLEIVAGHCAEEGRDPATLTNTRLGTVIIEPAAAEADRRLEEFAVAQGLDMEAARRRVTVGDPDTVGGKLQEFLDAGLDGLMFNMPGVERLEPVLRLGDVLDGLR